MSVCLHVSISLSLRNSSTSMCAIRGFWSLAYVQRAWWTCVGRRFMVGVSASDTRIRTAYLLRTTYFLRITYFLRRYAWLINCQPNLSCVTESCRILQDLCTSGHPCSAPDTTWSGRGVPCG
ncbi:hypothetical protein BDV36DRAFT_241367 [Aspergillus pseudocaelatus]|uniref:Secreted protein n=1 Tax=Aspergillus pseudocaelatus TaxID=1825620 RepID=A0ABQ6WBD4_9EURO|nr:hypothetical protein BDV36DRAFT_241367 [Aspergillus pseudocaelatus]